MSLLLFSWPFYFLIAAIADINLVAVIFVDVLATGVVATVVVVNAIAAVVFTAQRQKK